MSHPLETSLEDCIRAQAVSIPGWFETACIVDAIAAHDLRDLVIRLVANSSDPEALAEAQEWIGDAS